VLAVLVCVATLAMARVPMLAPSAAGTTAARRRGLDAASNSTGYQ
jgi:hypothetical protein